MPTPCASRHTQIFPDTTTFRRWLAAALPPGYDLRCRTVSFRGLGYGEALSVTVRDASSGAKVPTGPNTIATPETLARHAGVLRTLADLPRCRIESGEGTLPVIGI